MVFYQKNVNENLIFKQSDCGTAYYLLICDTSAKKLLLYTLQQEQWLVLFLYKPLQRRI